MFVLLGGLVCEIDCLLFSFLWRGGLDVRGAMHVAWDEVCMPKVEGGLGIHH